jgi:rhodanese-related sulfurtransferase
MIKTTVVLFLIILLCIILFNNIFHKANTDMEYLLISPEEAKSRRFGLILDVRTRSEREQYGYYPNSVNIPIDELTEQSITSLVSKDTTILVYCKKGIRASKAVRMLKKWGFKQVNYINQYYYTMMPGNTGRDYFKSV